MSTIYRKYRPQTFQGMSGQEHIIQTITNEIATGKVAHAYLFSGPRGVGKTTVARLLAKAVNCSNRKEGRFEPCDECPSCQEITNGRNIDVIEIDAASQTGVDNVRENIIENAQFKPTKSKYKVFIIDEVHMLSTSAFNALLKTLEEPPAHIIFIMATTELHKLPETVVSRCQRFNFKKIKYEEMMDRLEDIAKKEEIKIDKDVLGRVINKSDGCLRDAESLLGQIMSIGKKKITAEDAQLVLPVSDVESILRFIENLADKKAGEAIKLIDDLSANGANLDQFAYDLLEIMRLIMIIQAGSAPESETDYSRENNNKITDLSKRFSTRKTTDLIENILIARQQIKTSPLPQLPLEILAVKFCSTENDNQNTPDHANKIEDINTDKKNVAPVRVVELKIEKKVAEPIKIKPSGNYKINTTLEQIKKGWQDVIGSLSETNHSLVFILKMCELKSIDNSGLCISVPFSFHKDKLDEPKNKKVISEKLAEKFSESIPYYTEVVAGARPSETTTGDVELNNLAAQFGGEVI